MLDDALWPATAGLIDEACGIKGNILAFGDGHTNDDVELYLVRFCFRGQRRQDWEREYLEVYYPWDERLPRLRQLPDSQIVHVSDLYTEAELKTSPAYNEAMPRSDTQNSLNVRLDGPDGSRIVWGAGRPC